MKKVILKIKLMLPREKCENIRDDVYRDLNETGIAVVPDFVDVYILDDNTEDISYVDKHRRSGIN